MYLSFDILVSFLIGIKCKVILMMKMCEKRVLNKMKNKQIHFFHSNLQILRDIEKIYRDNRCANRFIIRNDNNLIYDGGRVIQRLF